VNILLSDCIISTGQSGVMSCGWIVKIGWLIPYVDKREDFGLWVAGIELCDPR